MKAATVRHIALLTLASVLAYLLTQAFGPRQGDLTAALTALLVVQASAHSTVKMSLVRIAAVITGVLVATAVSVLAGLTWWSLALAVFISLLAGQIFKLGDQILETPISAMLVLAVANHEIAAGERVLTTLMGAGVGVLVAIAFPRSVPNAIAASQVRSVADATAEALTSASRSLEAGLLTPEEVGRWLHTTRRAQDLLPAARTAVRQVHEKRRLNPRALTTTSTEPVLSTGLDAIEAALDAVEHLFSVISGRSGSLSGHEHAHARSALAAVLDAAARSVAGFGALVQAEAQGREQEVEDTLSHALQTLRDSREVLASVLLDQAHENEQTWLLNGSVLGAVERVLDRLDLEQRARLRRELRDGVVPVLQLEQLNVLHPSWAPGALGAAGRGPRRGLSALSALRGGSAAPGAGAESPQPHETVRRIDRRGGVPAQRPAQPWGMDAVPHPTIR